MSGRCGCSRRRGAVGADESQVRAHLLDVLIALRLGETPRRFVALYRRWASPDDLMADVIRSHVLEPMTAPSTDIRRQLIEIAMSILRLMQSEEGTFVLRMSSERQARQGVFERYLERVRDVIHSSNRSLVVAAIERGDLASDCDPDLLLHTITGSMLVSSLMAMAPEVACETADAEEYCGRVVDQVLRGSAPALTHADGERSATV